MCKIWTVKLLHILMEQYLLPDVRRMYNTFEDSLNFMRLEQWRNLLFGADLGGSFVCDVFAPSMHPQPPLSLYWPTTAINAPVKKEIEGADFPAFHHLFQSCYIVELRDVLQIPSTRVMAANFSNLVSALKDISPSRQITEPEMLPWSQVPVQTNTQNIKPTSL